MSRFDDFERARETLRERYANDIEVLKHLPPGAVIETSGDPRYLAQFGFSCASLNFDPVTPVYEQCEGCGNSEKRVSRACAWCGRKA